MRRQLEHEFGDVPDELVFVFGHTHKPFERIISSAAAREPVEVLNTGGWVVDSVEDDSVQGAAVVLLDERLEAVSVRCYQEGTTDTRGARAHGGRPGRVRARASPSSSTRTSASGTGCNAGAPRCSCTSATRCST